MNDVNDWFASSQTEALIMAAGVTRQTGEGWFATDCSFNFTERWAVKRASDGRCLSNGEARDIKARSKR